MSSNRSGRPGTWISEERRQELGHDRLFLRPPGGTKADLAKLAKKLGVSPSAAVAIAIDIALGKSSPLVGGR